MRSWPGWADANLEAADPTGGDAGPSRLLSNDHGSDGSFGVFHRSDEKAGADVAHQLELLRDHRNRRYETPQ